MNTDAIAARIRALLAKTVATGATEAEAMTAAEKARELMEKYRIEAGDLDKEPIRVETPEQRRGALIRANLMAGVGRFCQVMAYRGADDNFRFVGREGDVVFATWLLDALEAFVSRRTLDHVASLGGMSRGARDRALQSFTLGACARISERLREASPAVSRGEARAIAEYLKGQGIAIVTQKRRGSTTVDRDSFDAGRSAGDGAQFNRPVNAGQPVRRIAA